MKKLMAAEKKSTNFSLACNLLSKLVKQGSFNELGLDLSPRPQQQQTKGEPRSQPTTMNLLPGLDVSACTTVGKKADTVGVAGADESIDSFPQHKEDANYMEEDEEKKEAQLTIFYGGEVLVFDNFPLEKAKDLMQFASEGNSGGGVTELEPARPYTPPADLAMPPIARRASLHRFLAKRKDRWELIIYNAPYPVNDSKKACVGQEISLN